MVIHQFLGDLITRCDCGGYRSDPFLFNLGYNYYERDLLQPAEGWLFSIMKKKFWP